MKRRLDPSPDGLRRGVTHWAGEPVSVLEASWGVPRVEAHESLGSTNDRLRELSRASARPWTVVVSEEQTAGRGRDGSRWHSPRGTGIWMSVLLPQEPGGVPPLTPLLVGVAACRAIREVHPDLVPELKWPNDVLLRGRKVCGILCEGGGGAPAGGEVGEGGGEESGTGSTIAGLGINVRGSADDFPEDVAFRVITLDEAVRAAGGSGAADRTRLAGAVLRELQAFLSMCPKRIEGPLADEIDRLDALRGKTVACSTGSFGRAEGIDGDGSLLVREAGGTLRRVVAGSVRVISAG